MKVLKEGRPQKGWSKEFTCTGARIKYLEEGRVRQHEIIKGLAENQSRRMLTMIEELTRVVRQLREKGAG